MNWRSPTMRMQSRTGNNIMIRIIAKTLVLIVALAAFPQIGAAAPLVAYVSSTGSDSNPCTAAQPCATLNQASTKASSLGDGEILCINSPSMLTATVSFAGTIDCPGVLGSNAIEGTAAAISVPSHYPLSVRNLTITASYFGISITGSGTVVVENCVLTGNSTAIQIEPTGPLNVVVRNTTISGGGFGVMIKPASGGSVTATFDHVAFAQNRGAGIHVDSSNGPVTVDVIDSVIAGNEANGVYMISGSGTHGTESSLMTVTRSTIAANRLAGIEVDGHNAAVLLDATLLDSNLSGATDALDGGRVLSYGNNRIVGSAGSGFTASAPLQ
jgi:hypothetical protein